MDTAVRSNQKAVEDENEPKKAPYIQHRIQIRYGDGRHTERKEPRPDLP